MAAKAKTSSKAERRQPESLRLQSITPTFTANDLQASLAWYRDGLGFFVAERWEEGGRLEGVMLKAGACEFGLTQDDFTKGRDRAKGIGFRLWCSTTQDVDAIAARLRSFGGSIVEEPGERYDTYGFTAQDPDGFRITIKRAKD
jgi:catechol 2,3-dioxygenase-like lactoylglutathione lyase family enzyme